MSGGHFDYKQNYIFDIASEIDQFIKNNNSQELDRYGEKVGREYPPEIIERFQEASRWLRRAGEMAHRIDWLVSGDDGPESFMKRWDKEVSKP